MTEKDIKQTDDDDHTRTFLCVVDDSPELSQALRFTCRRVAHVSGRIALLYVIEPAEFEHWMAIKDLMEEERRQEAEEMLKVVASVVQKSTGTTPTIYIREGKLTEQLIELLDETPGISVLVLGAAVDAEGPGPLVSHLVNKMAGRLHIPITIVPGGLTDEEIDAIT